MAISEAQRLASKERMAAVWAERRRTGWVNPVKGRKIAPRNPEPKPEPQNVLSHRFDDVVPGPVLDMRVDWNRIPLTDAQSLFGKLKSELDRAAHALNQRLSDRPSFPCSGPGCSTVIKDGEEKFKDCAYVPARYICSEKCYMGYQQTEMARRNAARARR